MTEVHNESPAAAVILTNGCFCIIVLQQDQSHIANVFAGLNESRDGDTFGSCACIIARYSAPQFFVLLRSDMRSMDLGGALLCDERAPMPSGCARLENSLSVFDCQAVCSDLFGTHRVLIASVQEVYIYPQEQALLYGNRRYQQAINLAE